MILSLEVAGRPEIQMQSKSLIISYLTDNSVEISFLGDWRLTCEVVMWQSFQAQFEQYPEPPKKIDCSGEGAGVSTH